MHTLTLIAAGLALLALFCGAGRVLAGRPGVRRAARGFVPVWLVASVGNLIVGVVSAGYTVAEELPILLPVFGVPAVAAILVARRAGAR